MDGGLATVKADNTRLTHIRLHLTSTCVPLNATVPRESVRYTLGTCARANTGSEIKNLSLKIFSLDVLSKANPCQFEIYFLGDVPWEVLVYKICRDLKEILKNTGAPSAILALLI